MKKSKRETNTDDRGMIKRGKYIFLIMLALLTMLFPAAVIPVEKIFHKRRPEKTKIG